MSSVFFKKLAEEEIQGSARLKRKEMTWQQKYSLLMPMCSGGGGSRAPLRRVRRDWTYCEGLEAPEARNILTFGQLLTVANESAMTDVPEPDNEKDSMGQTLKG